MKALLISILLFVTSVVVSQDFTINHFRIDLTVNIDGSFDVVENIDVTFTKKKRGIYRSINNAYKKDGKKVGIGIRNISIPSHKSKVSRKNGQTVIRIGDKNEYIVGSQSYRITYTIQNGVQEYANHQEIFYDLTGNDWKADIELVDYTIHLPKSLTLGSNSLLATTGYDNENKDGITITQSDSRTIKGQTSRILNEGEGATIAVSLPKTYLSIAELAQNEYKEKLIVEEKNKVPQNPWLMILPVGLLGLFYSAWKKLFGDNHISDTQESYAYPPEGLTSAHVGAYIDQTAHTRDIVSLIPYWASEGFITIEEKNGETCLVKLKNLPKDYPRYEHTVFDEIFKYDQKRSMNSLKQKFYATLGTAKSELTKEVTAQGYYKENYVYWFRTWRLIIFPMIMFALAAIAFIVLRQAPLGISAIVIGVIGLFFGFSSLPLSDYGKEIKYKLDGLKKFLTDVPSSELDNLLATDPKYFDKMLPFAVAFGIDKTFIPKFEHTTSAMPLWYASDHNTHRMSHFQSAFNPEEISSAFSSTPPSSSGSSSAGGFSSGGGIGGGGGGSW